MHYEKLCMLQPHCLAIGAPKQLIYNYTTIIQWKYEELIKRMSCEKTKKLYCSCKLVAKETPIWWNVCIVYTIVINHV